MCQCVLILREHFLEYTNVQVKNLKNFDNEKILELWIFGVEKIMNFSVKQLSLYGGN